MRVSTGEPLCVRTSLVVRPGAVYVHGPVSEPLEACTGPWALWGDLWGLLAFVWPSPMWGLVSLEGDI